MRSRGVVIALACLIAGYGIYSLARARFDVFPEFAPPRVVVQIEAPGLSPEEVEALVTRPIESVMNGLSGLKSLRSMTERINETISGLTAQVIMEIYGDDLAVLNQKAYEAARVLSGIRGAVDVRVESPPGTPEMRVALRTDGLRQFGFRPVEVLEAVHTAYQGSVVAEVSRGTRMLDVVVILDPKLRESPETIGSLMVRNSTGARIPLRQLADIHMSAGRTTIVHYGTRRVQTVSCATSAGEACHP